MIGADLIGQKFGKLTVFENIGSKEDRTGRAAIYWKCKCECGGEKELSTSTLRAGNTKSCGCIHKKDNIVGQIFGRLTVIERIGSRTSAAGLKAIFYKATCECGGKWEGMACTLRKKNGTKSCGCAKENGGTIIHGLVGTREYRIYYKMIERCTNPKSDKYLHYGGRGILICERWLSDIKNFISDMGFAPSPKHSIDRIEVNGNYEPSNCRWATQKEQMNNTRSNKIIEFNGEKLTLSHWCDRFNTSAHLVRGRVRKGWEFERALKAPARKDKRQKI